MSAELSVPRGRARNRVALAAAPLCIVVLLTGCAADIGDAALVYCLAPAQQAPMVAAADALGLAEPGKRPGTVHVESTDLGLEDWSRTDAEAFSRACKAIRPASTQPSTQSNWLVSFTSSVVNVLLGALLTLGATYLSGGLARSRQTADALREAVQRLVRWMEAARAFQTRRTREEPSEIVLFDRVSMLDTALRRARSHLRDDRAVTSLLRELDALTDRLMRPRSDAATQELTAAVSRLQDGVEQVAAALDRPLRRRRPASTTRERSPAG